VRIRDTGRGGRTLPAAVDVSGLQYTNSHFVLFSNGSTGRGGFFTTPFFVLFLSCACSFTTVTTAPKAPQLGGTCSWCSDISLSYLPPTITTMKANKSS
jgi:hypothetical protein